MVDSSHRGVKMVGEIVYQVLCWLSRRWGFIWLVLIASSPVRADHDLDIYATGDVFVYDLLLKDGRIINFVSLRDSLDLVVVGHVKTDSYFPLSSYGHDGTTLLISFHDRVEIYDISQPALPVLEQVLKLRDPHGNHLRWPEIAKLGSRYFVLSGEHVFALHPPTNGAKWMIERAEKPPAINKEHIMKSRFPSYFYAHGEEWPFVVSTTDRYRYEAGWQVRREPNLRVHEKYLWKVLLKDGSIVSSLKLGEIRETFGE